MLICRIVIVIIWVIYLINSLLINTGIIDIHNKQEKGPIKSVW